MAPQKSQKHNNRRDPYGPQGRKLPDRIQAERDRAAAVSQPLTTAQEYERENLLLSNTAAASTAGRQSGNSTPRGGHHGNRGKSRASFFQNAGGDSRQASSRGMELIPRITAATYTEISDNHGNTRFRADQHNAADGNPNNWVASLHNRGLIGTTPHTQGIAAYAENLMRERGCKNITFMLIPTDQKDWESVAKNEVQRRVRKADGLADNGKPQGIGENEGSLKPAKDEQDCPHCVKAIGVRHGLVDCISSCSKGELVGCIICNKINHNTDDCMLFKGMNLTEKVEWLVTKRANKPPLMTKVPWFRVLHQWCMSPEYDANEIKGFPWTKTWTRHRHNEKNKTYLYSIQKRYDADRKFPLKVDPSTENFAAIWTTFWEVLDLPWPNAIGIKDQKMGNDITDFTPVLGIQAGLLPTSQATPEIGSQAGVEPTSLAPVLGSQAGLLPGELNPYVDFSLGAAVDQQSAPEPPASVYGDEREDPTDFSG
ncbi:hypothetical protein NW752_008537 [Fusarium irregulare]|uniref:Uncharacterized protein n=1 Tax=Fusarium irregulare TaxID=2494466 RepID=A0A9W8UDT0_9HYPO|nr:hypothetical protein NW752_008537 [Fusarium irregulare]KAJ4020465.1 hypothetical protein NW766_001952 [Fusarium irregulare]